MKMFNGVRFITAEETVVFHDVLIDIFGGSKGLRDYGLLESAIHQPMLCFDDKFLYPHIADMAGAYFFYILKNHPFVDGNKRAGTAVTLFFLSENNYGIDCSHDLLYNFAIQVAASEVSKEDILKTFNTIIHKKI